MCDHKESVTFKHREHLSVFHKQHKDVDVTEIQSHFTWQFDAAYLHMTTH